MHVLKGTLSLRRRLLLAAGVAFLASKANARVLLGFDETKRRMTTMSSLAEATSVTANRPRYSETGQKKAEGATYTPNKLATFVAANMLGVATLPKQTAITILDPAVGDGELLLALLDKMPAEALAHAHVTGFDTSASALASASSRLQSKFPNLSLTLECQDFLNYVLKLASTNDLFSSSGNQGPKFDLVIANPPYVRTQIIGAQQSKELSQRFGLTGRVDLYYPFLIAISQVLAVNGVAGIITSNRFMTTRSGQAVRRALLSRFNVIHAWDLGDTKLFNAAVLPAVLLAKGTEFLGDQASNEVAFSSIYETNDDAQKQAVDALAALSVANDTVVKLSDNRRFRVRHGTLSNGGNPAGVWRIATTSTDAWLDTVKANTWATFREIGKVRVGVKTTADKVFVRSDWDELGSEKPELLRPLITRHCAQRFKAMRPKEARHVKQILYPHEATNVGRATVDLSLYPKSKRYLENHRDVLEARSYVIQAGRQWYEIWVPQDPAAWIFTKLVFPDISEKPTFWIDRDGAIVNGECYWLRCENGADPELLWLALAVANSTFIESFYDHRFNNKLYAGRRRFITQYVEHFPLPNPAREESREIVELAKKIYQTTPSREADISFKLLDDLIWTVFGLRTKESAG